MDTELRSQLRGVFSLNVDIDSIHLYHRIHGLAEHDLVEPDPIWHKGIPRFLRFFEALGLTANFFVVASDLCTTAEGGSAPNQNEAEWRQDLMRSMIASGHNIASHSFSHDYALSRQPQSIIANDIKLARQVLDPLVGKPVLGFRAPGYLLSRELVTIAQDSGAIYSSSRLPSPPYFAAKYLAMVWGLATRRTSHSIVGDIVAPFTSRLPYRHQEGLLELPITVISPLRFPAVGTFFTLYGDLGQRWLLPRLLAEDWLNIEFHGIDLVDGDDSGVHRALRGLQPDLRCAVSRKLEVFGSWLAPIAERRKGLTLEEVTHMILKHDMPIRCTQG